MSLNEPFIEDTTLEWFGELVPQVREVGHGPQFAPGEYAGSTLTRPLPRGKEKRAVIRRLNAVIPQEVRGLTRRST